MDISMSSLSPRIHVVLRLCFALLIFMPQHSFSNENDSAIKAIETLTIVRGAGSYPPLEMIEEDGRLKGLHIAMLRHVAAKLDIELEFVSLPWARAIKYFSEGKVDAITYFGYTKEREKYSYYEVGNVLSNTRWVFLALEERKDEFSFDISLAGLQDLIVGVQHGYSYGKYLDGINNFTRDVVLSELDIENMLRKKRHDLSLMSYQEFMGFKEKGGFKGIVPLSPGINADPQYIAFSRVRDKDQRLEKLAAAFGQELLSFKDSAEYQTLLNTYDFHVYK